jgi:drug/metabolite transporter (DMT)-like permease
MPSSAALFALGAIALWSFFGYLADRLSHVPALLLVGIAACVGGVAGSFAWRSWRVPWRAHLLGVVGIGGNMLLYFSSFRHAPAVEVNLINYLWPLLVVLLSPLFLPGMTLGVHHVAGGLLGFAGAALVVTGGSIHVDAANLLGYGLSASGAVLWACYSLLLKRLPPQPTAAVGGYCLSSGALLLACHFAFAPSIEPVRALSGSEWLLIALTGLGPLGLAYFLWDAAMKRGDPRVIGSLAFLTPLASTLILAAVGGHALGWVAIVAMAAIIGGAALGSLRPRPSTDAAALNRA